MVCSVIFFFFVSILMMQSELFLASNPFSIVVGANSYIGGVSGTKGSQSNSMRAHNVLDNRNSVGGGHSSVAEGKASVGQAGVGIDGYIGISLPLDNMLDSMVLGNVLGSDHSERLSSVMVGVVVAGDLVGGRGNSTVGGERADNMAANRVGSGVVEVAAGGVGDRANYARVGAGQRRHSSVVEKSRVSLRLSISLSLANGMDSREGSVGTVRIGVYRVVVGNHRLFESVAKVP